MTPPPQPPFTRAEARKLAREIVDKGAIVYNEPHAKERMVQRRISQLDVENVIRGGFINDEPELSERGTWRYKICTNRFYVVVEFYPGRIFVVTAIRI
jgi:hypothetical protein